MDPFWVEPFSALKRPNSINDNDDYIRALLDINYNRQEDEMKTHEDQTDFVSQLAQAEAQVRNQSGVSSGIILNQTNGSTVQASQSPNTSNAPLLTNSLSTLSRANRERKRQTDQTYRQKLKKHKAEMESDLKNLTGENESLKTENQYLKEDNAYINQTLIDQAKEIEQLRSDLLQLKHDHGKQNVLLQTLSGLLSDPLRLENEKLKDENASLRKNANLSNNLPQLLEENAKLRVENKMLKVQNDALCGKIIGEYDKKRATS